MIDFCIASSESEAEWEGFLAGLHGRGLKLNGTELICVGGGKGCLRALKTVHPSVPIKRCWAHKIRNITDKVKKIERRFRGVRRRIIPMGVFSGKTGIEWRLFAVFTY